MAVMLHLWNQHLNISQGDTVKLGCNALEGFNEGTNDAVKNPHKQCTVLQS